MAERLSETELYIMNLFWQHGAMKSDALARLVEEKGWKATTLLTFLSRLATKGMLTVEKQGKSNLYRPLVSGEEYRRREGKQFLEDMFGGSAKGFLAAMADSGDLSAADLQDLRHWLAEQEVDDNA